MPRTKTLTAAALSALALTGVAAQSASADSIAYLKGGDIWLSTGDGARQFQVTSGGGYSSVTQSENGTLAGLKGERIHKLDRFGNVLADFSTAVSDGHQDGPMYGASHFEGPFDIDLSPDGTKVAYNFYWQYWTWSGWTGYHMLRKGVAVSHSDRNTSWEEPGMGNQTGWSDSDWYDDDTLLLSHKASAGMMDVSLDDLGTKTSDSQDWFYYEPEGEEPLKDMRRAAVNRQHTFVAEVADYKGGEHLDIWSMTGEGPKNLPAYCSGYGNPAGGKYEHISFAPDGSPRLLFEDGAGINLVNITCPGKNAATMLIPGGTDPDWGPADVPTSRPAPPQPQPQPQPAPPQQPAPVVTKPKGGGKTTEAGTLVESITCKRKCTVTGKVTVPSKLAKKLGLRGAVATGTARASKKGKVTLKLKATAAGRKALSKLKGQKLTLRVTIKEGGKTRRITKKVTLA